MPKTERMLSQIINNTTYIDYFDRLKLLAISLFSYENLDKIAGVGASRFLEKALFENGRACFVKNKTLGYQVLYANPSDKLNIYYLPTKINAWSIGQSDYYDFDDIVYIMNNNLEKPTIETIKLFAYKLYDVQRTIDTNLNAQRTPVLIEGDTKTILTLKNAYAQYTGNMPVIFGNKQFDISNKLNCIKTDAPYLVDKLEMEKQTVVNDCLTFLGINNVNFEKQERLVTDEANANNQLIQYYLQCFYKTRQDAVDQINEKFLKDSDLKIKLKININDDEFKQEMQEIFDSMKEESEVTDNGSLYNDNQDTD